jgi:hypothetical protein
MPSINEYLSEINRGWEQEQILGKPAVSEKRRSGAYRAVVESLEGENRKTQELAYQKEVSNRNYALSREELSGRQDAEKSRAAMMPGTMLMAAPQIISGAKSVYGAATSLFAGKTTAAGTAAAAGTTAGAGAAASAGTTAGAGLSAYLGPMGAAGAAGMVGGFIGQKIIPFGGEREKAAMGGAMAGALAGSAMMAWSGPGAILGAIVGGISGLFGGK